MSRQSGRRFVPGHAPAQNGNKRSIRVLPRPDKLISYRQGRFVWPPIVDGAMTLTPAQLAVLVEAMDWRRTVAPEPPRRPMLV